MANNEFKYSNAHNFGAIMQTYAMQKYLESLNHEAKVIDYRNSNITKSYLIIKKKPRPKLISKTIYFAKYTVAALRRPHFVKRRKKYEAFISRHLNLTETFYSIKQLRNSNLQFDAVILGSDQVWNSGITKGLDPAYFGDFVNENTIKISYAPSIGNDKVDEKYHELFRQHLRSIDFLSVRELNAKKELENLTDKPIQIVLDPTFLVKKNVYTSIEKNISIKEDYIYVHVHHYSGKAPLLAMLAEELSMTTGLPIVHNIKDYKFKYQLKTVYSSTPDETLGYIRDAHYVISQSFHITAFSIIYEKEFFVVSREKYNDRLTAILDQLDLSGRFISNKDSLLKEINHSINYEHVNSKLSILKEKSHDYLTKSLSGKKQKVDDYFISKDPYTCYGCYTCSDRCPTGAINMKKDDEGFFFPQVDDNLCIHCDLCRKVCIYNGHIKNQSEETASYIAWQKDDQERSKSTSGGIFAALSKYVLKQNGYVIGVKYDNDLNVIYDIASTVESAQAFRFSKYVEPKDNNIFYKTKSALETGKLVLFTGSPCKIAGLKNYLGKEWSNLILVDLICHCTSSHDIFDKYLSAKEYKEKSKIVRLKFRDKSRGWSRKYPATTIEFNNGKIESYLGRKSLYYNCFVSGYLAKKSCYDCMFCGNNRIADMTIGDFWGVEKYIDASDVKKGYSALTVNSNKGFMLLNEITNQVNLHQVELTDIYHNNHNWPVDLKPNRKEIFQEIVNDDVDILHVLKKHNALYKKRI